MGEERRDAAGAQIAIDGAAGVGKSTVGERVARRLGYLYIDSGAFYRALTLQAQRRGVAFDDEPALLALIAEAPIHIAAPAAQSSLAYAVYAGDDPEDLAPALHNLDVTRAVSTVARIPAVRDALIARMREMANAHSVVMVGRDIGKVVLPSAPVKIALTAPADERARRRHADLVAALGDGAPALAQVLEDIEARDRKDAGQMDLAPDAVNIENRDGQLDTVVDQICVLAQPAPKPEPAAVMPRASSREGAYVAPPVTAPRDVPWDGTTHPRFYRVVQTLAGMIFPLFFKLRIEGRENIPTTGSVMLAANHVAWIDIPLLAQPLKRFTHYMAKVELFQVPVIGYIIGMCGNFPVRRGEGDRESLRIADRLLTSGEVVAIFPEGHRTGGALIRGLPGVSLIALRANAPVVPVGIINSNEVFKKGRIIFNRPTVTIRYGKPFMLAKSGARHSKADLERGIDEIMTQIAALLPQEYRGIYGERLAGTGQAAELAAPAPSSGDGSAPRV
ncbi:MAG TPA: (d)CMP kinase [Ktedonobacterales bacterium]